MVGLSTWNGSVLRRWSRGETHRNAVARRWRFVLTELDGSARLVQHRLAGHRAERCHHQRPQWAEAPTMAYPQVGRAGWLTLAQTWRANGGRW